MSSGYIIKDSLISSVDLYNKKTKSLIDTKNIGDAKYLKDSSIIDNFKISKEGDTLFKLDPDFIKKIIKK